MTITLTAETVQEILESNLDSWLVVALCETWMSESGVPFLGNSPRLHLPKSPGVPTLSHPAFNAELHRRPLNTYIAARIRESRPLINKLKSQSVGNP